MLKDILLDVIQNAIISPVQPSPTPPPPTGSIRITADSIERITADDVERIIAGV